MKKADDLQLLLVETLTQRIKGIWQGFIKQGKYKDKNFEYHVKQLESANAQLLSLIDQDKEVSVYAEWFGDVFRRLSKTDITYLFTRALTKQPPLDTRVYLSDEFDYLKDEKLTAKKLSNDPVISVVYPFRDRNIERLSLSINSLKAHSSVEFEVIVVDYGANSEYAAELRLQAKVCDYQVVRTETEGLPWSRGAALNIGLRTARGKYVVTTDIDMIFDDDVLGWCVANAQPNTIFHCRPLWLGRDGKRERASLGDYAQLGGFQFMSKDTIMEVQGFNENIKFWGLEDVELDRHITNKGCLTTWIDGGVKMYHMWHPTNMSSTDSVRPVSSWFDSSEVLMSTIARDRKDQPHWGRPVGAEERPILKIMKSKTPAVFKPETVYEKEIGQIVELGKAEEYVVLELGDRFMNMQAPEFIHFLHNIAPYYQEFGIEFKPTVNSNLDYFYLSLPILQHLGLVDYFFNPDYAAVHLLFKK